MNILVIGEDESKLSGIFRQGETHTITHCADGVRALAEPRNGSSKYDWIVVQGDANVLINMEVAGAIRAMGLSVPLVLADEAGDMGLPVNWIRLFPQCQDKSIQNRFQILPYALLKLIMDPARLTHRGDENDVIILESHAPVKKRYDA